VTNVLLPFTPTHVAAQTMSSSAEDHQQSASKYLEQLSLAAPGSSSSSSGTDMETDDATYEQYAGVSKTVNHIYDCLFSNTQSPIVGSSSAVGSEQSDVGSDQFVALVEASSLAFTKKYGLKWVTPDISDTANSLQYKNKNVLLMRKLHSLWSAAATTIITNKPHLRAHGAAHGAEDSSASGPVGVDVTSQLLLCARMFTLQVLRQNEDIGLGDCLRNILFQLLIGEPEQSVSSEVPERSFRLFDADTISVLDYQLVMRSVPFTVVSATNTLLTPGRISKLLQLGVDKQFLPSQDDNGTEDDRSITHMWGVLPYVPLLSHELSMLAVACISVCAQDIGAMKELCAHLMFARLAQILLEPMTRNVTAQTGDMITSANSVELAAGASARKLAGNTNSLTSDTVERIAEAASALQQHLLGTINPDQSADTLAPRPSAGKGQLLLLVLLDSWLPFVEYVCALLDVMRAYAPSTAQLGSATADINFVVGDNSSDVERVLGVYISRCFTCFNMLGIQKDLLAVFTSEPLAQLSACWCRQLRRRSLSIAQPAEFSNFQTQAEIAEADSPRSQGQLSSGAGAGAAALAGQKGNGANSRKRPLGDDVDGLEYNEFDSLLDEYGGLLQEEPLQPSPPVAQATPPAGQPADAASPDQGALAPHPQVNILIEDPEHPENNQALPADLSNNEFEQLQALLQAQEGAADSQEASNQLWQWMMNILQQQEGGGPQASASTQQQNQSLQQKLTTVPADWKLVGVDPTYPFVDNFLGNSFLPDRHITNIHAMTPLQGCVSGTMCAYGVNGECVNDFYCELSHAVGLSGLRHRRKLISLPAMYTDIYQRVSVTAELMHLQMLLLV
jgi:hypothetical protein